MVLFHIASSLVCYFEYAKVYYQKHLEKFNTKHPFKGVHGAKWWALFKQRHPKICLRYTNGLEVRKALGFIELKEPDKHSLLENHMFNKLLYFSNFTAYKDS